MYVSSISPYKKDMLITYINMNMALIFVLNLKKWRKSRGFSQKVLAEKCNAAHSYIRQIESGKGHPSFAFIEKLANALNIEPYKLFIDETITESDRLAKSKSKKTVKSDFLEKVGREFDDAIDKIMH